MDQDRGCAAHARDEKGRHYFAFIGEALVVYLGSSPAEFVARRAVPLHGDGCGESESVAAANNYPFSDGRWIGRDKPDDTEMIIVHAPALR